MDSAAALRVVDRLARTIQRMRSLALEQEGDSPQARLMLADLAPYVHGAKCLLPTLAQIQDRGFVTPSELHSLLFIAHTLEPSIALHTDIMALASGTPTLPEPSFEWLRHPWPVPASV